MTAFFLALALITAQSTHIPSSMVEKTPEHPLINSHVKKVSGKATWYCVPGVSVCHRNYANGMYAAAGSELRKGNWRGSKVRVCTSTRCVVVTLVDWCACKGDRIIDLYGMAFRKLAPLSRGVLQVSVSPHREKNVHSNKKTRPSRSPVVLLPETSSSLPVFGRPWRIIY